MLPPKIILDTSWLFGYIAKYDKGEIKMKSMVKPQHEARAKIIKAMAHPSRLFIIEELSKNECCVGELTDMIGADASTVSKHLSVLKNAGLVTDEKRGNSIFYSLRCPCIMDFIGCLEDVLSSNAKQHNEILKCCKK
jgi:ArsR family transcriptional regulator, arsenate/arsenite/antimonite-responsive transcriptional repressor